MCDNGVLLERDEDTRSMELPLDLYGTDEQATLGGTARGECRTASACPCCRPESSRDEQVG